MESLFLFVWRERHHTRLFYFVEQHRCGRTGHLQEWGILGMSVWVGIPVHLGGGSISSWRRGNNDGMLRWTTDHGGMKICNNLSYLVFCKERFLLVYIIY